MVMVKKVAATVVGSVIVMGGMAAPTFASTYNFNGDHNHINIVDNSKTVVNTVTFNDLGNYGWAKDAIQAMAKKGIINGVGNKQFAPGQELTRAQFAMLVTKEFSLPVPTDAQQDFVDVPPTTANGKPNWEFKAVEAARDYFTAFKDISTGGLDFHPEEKMNRQDVAVTLVKILEKAGLVQLDSADQVQQVMSKFSDLANVPTSVQPYIATAVTNKFMSGVGNGHFDPARPLLRAEAAVLLYKVQNQLTVVPGDPTTAPTSTQTTTPTQSSSTTSTTDSTSQTQTTTDGTANAGGASNSSSTSVDSTETPTSSGSDTLPTGN